MNLKELQVLLIVSKNQLNLQKLSGKVSIACNIELASAYRIINRLFKDGFIAKTINNQQIELILTTKGLNEIDKVKDILKQ